MVNEAKPSLTSRHAVPTLRSPQQSCDVRYTGRRSMTACVNGVLVIKARPT